MEVAAGTDSPDVKGLEGLLRSWVLFQGQKEAIEGIRVSDPNFCLKLLNKK